MSSPSGRFVLRVPSELHRRLREESRQGGISLNTKCLELLNSALNKTLPEAQIASKFQWVTEKIQAHFGDDTLGVLIFGSTITGGQTASSDVDFLIVLRETVPLTRSLYRWWDETIISPPGEGPEPSPQFVHLPHVPEEAGGLWFEVAVAHEVLWQKGQIVSNAITALRKLIDEDRIRRYWTNGHPYWVWQSR